MLPLDAQREVLHEERMEKKKKKEGFLYLEKSIHSKKI